MAYISLLVHILFHRLIFPYSYLIGGTIPSYITTGFGGKRFYSLYDIQNRTFWPQMSSSAAYKTDEAQVQVDGVSVGRGRHAYRPRVGGYLADIHSRSRLVTSLLCHDPSGRSSHADFPKPRREWIALCLLLSFLASWRASSACLLEHPLEPVPTSHRIPQRLGTMQARRPPLFLTRWRVYRPTGTTPQGYRTTVSALMRAQVLT